MVGETTIEPLGALPEVPQVQAVCGNRLVRTNVGCGDELPAYRLDGEMPMMFELSGPFDDPATTITTIWAGSQGSC